MAVVRHDVIGDGALGIGELCAHARELLGRELAAAIFGGCREPSDRRPGVLGLALPLRGHGAEIEL
jgi:hypothetical protein